MASAARRALTRAAVMWHALRMHRTLLLVPALVLAALPAAAAPLPDGLYAEITTPRGVIVCRLEYRKAPMTVSSFVGLAEGILKANGAAGKRYFDGLTFHRVEPGFVIQGGDPKGNGSGGPGYQFPNEISPELKHDGPGVLAMANSGPNTNGCQFYITLRATPQLDGGYSVFGKVVQGQDVVTKIQKGDRMTTVKILRVGADAQAFKVTQASFDALVGAAKAKLRAADLATAAKKYPGLAATPSGLQYKTLKQGSGPSPTDGATVTVHYTGWLLDGTKFDSSKDGGGPATFRIGQVIEGWNEALKSMKKGETRLLVIPPELAYGERGYPGAIPGNAFLVFEVELISF
jgi:peptidyl-prolyl cis-trans isomerase A (cyclophilin A)